MTGSVSKSDTGQPISARNLVVAAVLIGALIGALLSLFAQDVERRLVFDTWQRIDSRTIEPDEVVVVMIDDDSVAAKGQWPWLRFHMAQLIDRISAAKPAAIGVDIYFTDEDPQRPEAFVDIYPEELPPDTRAEILSLPNWDETLADIIARPSAPTVMARVGAKEGGSSAAELPYDYIEGEPPAGTQRVERIISSFPALEGDAFSHGIVDGDPDADGVVRRVPLSVWAGETLESGFAVELAKVKLGEDMLRWQDGSLVLGDRVIPADANAQLQFKMGAPQPYYPAIDVLEERVSPDDLHGKVVIIGVGATGTGDIVATPHGNEVLGTLVQAQAVDAILKREWLSHPIWAKALEWGLAACIFCLILLGAMTAKRWPLFLAGGIALAMPLVSVAAYMQGNILFDPARAMIVAIFAGGALLLARFYLAQKELVVQRIRAAEQKKENEAARDIQMSMVPSAATLSRLDPRTEIGAVLEPAKSVGGDFFDAIKIGQDKLLFLVGDVSGKGMPAALFMALSKMLSKSNLARAGDGLEAAVASLNHELMEEADEEMGLTMLIGLIDCSTGAIQLVNAGHENPLLVRTDGTVETLGLVGGPPFCVIDFPYPVESYQLAVGETLVVITDGATEAFDKKQQQFGTEGVLAALAASHGSSAPERATHLAKQVRLFEGEADATDDLTIFAMRYVGETTE